LQYDFTPLEIAAMSGSRANVRALLQATTPIASIPDWSVDGILEYVQSAEAENQVCDEFTRPLFVSFVFVVELQF